MNEQTEQPVDSAADDQPDTPEADQPTGNAEAAKYRRRLREAEAERDALAQRLSALQRAEVERVAADRIVKPAALWASGLDVADLLDEHGNVDPEKVSTAADQAVADLGLATVEPGASAPLEGTGDGRSHGTRPGLDGMADNLSRRMSG